MEGWCKTHNIVHACLAWMEPRWCESLLLLCYVRWGRPPGAVCARSGWSLCFLLLEMLEGKQEEGHVMGVIGAWRFSREGKGSEGVQVAMEIMESHLISFLRLIRTVHNRWRANQITDSFFFLFFAIFRREFMWGVKSPRGPGCASKGTK